MERWRNGQRAALEVRSPSPRGIRVRAPVSPPGVVEHVLWGVGERSKPPGSEPGCSNAHAGSNPGHPCPASLTNSFPAAHAASFIGCVAERLIAPGCKPGPPSEARWFESIHIHQFVHRDPEFGLPSRWMGRGSVRRAQMLQARRSALVALGSWTTGRPAVVRIHLALLDATSCTALLRGGEPNTEKPGLGLRCSQHDSWRYLMSPPKHAT